MKERGIVCRGIIKRAVDSGVVAYDYEPTFNQDVLFYEGKYYQIGAEHKEFRPNKIMDEDYYILTLAAIACELKRHGRTEANVHLAVGLPLTWVSEQKEAFKSYLLQRETVEFSFHGDDYHVCMVGADVFPQGFAAVAGKLKSFKGVNMLVDIGNGTMNIMYINNGKPVVKKCYTEKYGINQCVMAVRESILKQFGKIIDDTVIQQVLRFGTAEISERYLNAIRETARTYVDGIFRKLRENEKVQESALMNSSNTTDSMKSLIQEQSEKLEIALSTYQELLQQNQDLQGENRSLRIQLYETQRLNQKLSSENDSLRNRSGLMLRKQQEQLERKIEDVQARNSKLEEMVYFLDSKYFENSF